MIGELECGRCDDVGSLKPVVLCVYFGLQATFGIWESLQFSDPGGASL